MRKCNQIQETIFLEGITKPQKNHHFQPFACLKIVWKFTAPPYIKVFGGGFVIVFYLLANNLLSFSETNYLHLANI